MDPQKLYNKVKGNRPALHTLITFLGYSKPNYDRLKEEVEEMLNVDADNLPVEFIKLISEEYYK